MVFLYYILAILTGVGASVQSGVNAQLRQGLNNPLLAALGSFGTGFLSLLLVQVVIGTAWPTPDTLRSISWWKWTGGLLGAFYVSTIILTVPKIGPASLLSLSVAGQLLAALVLDHYGWLGFRPTRPLPGDYWGPP